MNIRTLQHISIQELTACWNLAFSDYTVPFQVSPEHLQNSLDAENVQLHLCVGTFGNDTLTGFVLTGIDTINGRPVAYNAGTGVVPLHRGRRTTSSLYAHLVPLLKAEGIQRRILEVITGNKRAFKVYEALGYRISRMLDSHEGSVSIAPQPLQYTIKPLNDIDAATWQSFWDWQPSWQNGMMAVRRIFETVVAAGAFDENGLVGYIVYNPLQKRIHQFAVDKGSRRSGVGKALFHYIAAHYDPELSVINVDADDLETAEFLKSLGLRHFLQQYEMVLDLA